MDKTKNKNINNYNIFIRQKERNEYESFEKNVKISFKQRSN